MPAAAQNATWNLNPTVAGPSGGTFDYNGAANWTPATIPAGTATFGATNGPSLSFSAANTSIGGWTFNAGAAAYTFGLVGQTLTFNGDGIVINGGSATLNVNANGALTSTVQFRSASTAGNATIINNNSPGAAVTTNTVEFLDASTAGNATISNNRNLNFRDSSTAGNARIVNTAITEFFNASTAGNATITENGFLVFHNTSTAGNATITNIGGTAMNFEDTSTAGNATIINNFGLAFANSSTAGAATITTNSGGTTFIQDSASGGTARFILNGTGALDISGLTSGGTTAGSIEGGGNIRLGANTLAVGGSNLSTNFSGIISGSGGLSKAGGGTLTLTGINTYTGSTAVNGGTLEVDGSIAASSNVTVNSGATLSGTGIVDPAATTIMNGGTLAPGNVSNPTGTLTVTSNLALQSGAIYLVQVTPALAASSNVSGTATLGGATVNAAFANGSYISKQYTILSAGSVSGTFGTLTNANLPTNFTDALSYDATHAYLNLTLNFTPPPSGPTAPNFGGGLNLNQQAVANTLVNFFNSTGGIPMVYGTLTPAGLTQASGELATGSQQTTFDAMNLFLGLLTDPFMNRACEAGSAPRTPGYPEENDASGCAAARNRGAFAMFTKAPPVPFVPRWSVWAAGYGGSRSTDGNAVVGSNDTTSSVYGTAVGADYLFSPNTIAGFALAGGGTNFSVVNGGSGRSDLFQAGAYIRHTEGAAYISAALAYGWQDITTNRIVTVAGFDQLRAEFNANTYSGRVEGGYRFVAPWSGGIGITPYAAGQFTTFDLPGYAEQAVVGSPAFALAYDAKSVTDVRSELGLRTDKSFAMADGMLTLRTRFAWAHDYDPDRSIAAAFQALPGASFVVNGAAQASDLALTTAAVEMKWMNGWSAAATFEGEFSDVTSSYAGKGVVRYTW
ncbi:autotransporter domain-containing protein [Bradyrhizobium genosp. L]|uniref:autotransporter outer membrane beta-barrel domain-containing protein n=1 Tax=Bradyrhizobium genosp. L TaxID=83637 RepID=UPI0018A292D4|nr:autotransporter outer membrane beta-barrel domain-containing protein [Bradyrhizobium genosp. L]QPF87188.1 autotransporter domain-containing protein [Bradyrhizobium genosp. L]